MGIAGIIPGVSSGTVAVISGVYPEMISSLNALTTKKMKKRGPALFLVILVVGMGLATFLFAGIMERLMAVEGERMSLFFIGLIIGSIPLLYRKMQTYGHHDRLKPLRLIPMMAAFMLVFWINTHQGEPRQPLTSVTFAVIAVMFLAGIISSAAGLFPGISGSMVLLALGIYSTMIHALTNFHLILLIALALGAFSGFILCSRLIHYLLVHHAGWSYSVIIGFLLASALFLWPGFTVFEGFVFISGCVFIFLLGFALAMVLGGERSHA